MSSFRRLLFSAASVPEAWISRLATVESSTDDPVLPDGLSETVAVERLVCWIRLTGAIFSALIVPFIPLDDHSGVYGVLAFAAFYSLFLLTVVIPNRPTWLQRGYLPWVLDATALMLAVALTGGIRSDFFVIYYLGAVLQCLRFGQRQMFFSPLISTVSYTMAISLAGDSIVASAGVLGFRVLWVFIIAFVLTVLVRRARTAEASLDTELQRTRALLRAAHAPATSLTVDGVVDAMLQQSGLLTKADVCAVLLYRREGQPAVFRSEGEETAAAGALLHMIRSNSLVRKTLLTAHGTVLPATLMERSPSVPGGIGQFADLCAAPILGRRGEIGLVAVAHRQANGMGQVYYEVLRAFLERAALALQNARLYEQLQVQVEELRSLHSQIVRAERLAALGELAAKVAHELNNPLTSIHLYSSLLLEETAEPAEQRRLAAIMLEQADRAKQVVRDILDYSRPTEAKLELASLNVTVESSLRLVRHVAHAAHVSIIEDYAGSLPAVRVDLGQMAQICTNLALNAVQAMSSGGSLIISTGTQGDELYVSFKDNGSGIPPEHLPRVFEPFFTTKPAGQGTGLGLAVCRTLAMQQHGRLTVESEVGKGTTFTLWLPAARSQEGMLAGPHTS